MHDAYVEPLIFQLYLSVCFPVHDVLWVEAMKEERFLSSESGSQLQVLLLLKSVLCDWEE